MSEPIILTPNAPTMLNSLRALGYSFNTAVADIVDNSIAAGADRVDVSLGGGEGESPFLAISDNGRGDGRRGTPRSHALRMPRLRVGA